MKKITIVFMAILLVLASQGLILASNDHSEKYHGSAEYRHSEYEEKYCRQYEIKYQGDHEGEYKRDYDDEKSHKSYREHSDRS